MAKTYRLDFYRNEKPETVIGAEEDGYFTCEFYTQKSAGLDTVIHASGEILHRSGGAVGENKFTRYFGNVYNKKDGKNGR